MEQIISADAARAYLHISKRKFLFMLQNGYIRYEDNGNKTHRYSLRMCDVEALRKEMTDHPERFADLNGRFTAQRNKPPTPTVALSQEEARKLREYIKMLEQTSRCLAEQAGGRADRLDGGNTQPLCGKRQHLRCSGWWKGAHQQTKSDRIPCHSGCRAESYDSTDEKTTCGVQAGRKAIKSKGMVSRCA